MTETEEEALKRLAKDIEFGPTRHGEIYPFALKKIKEAYAIGAASKQQSKKEE